MKTLIVFLGLLVFYPLDSHSQNNRIVGFIKVQSSGNHPLSGVEVWSLGANSVYTNHKGYFELSFPNLKPGDVIRSIEVSKEKYSVINEDELLNRVIARKANDLQIVIIMAKSEEYRKQKARHYKIIVENVNKKFENDLIKVDSKLSTLTNNAKERGILLKQIDDLRKEKEKLIENAQELAKRFAEVDLDLASNIAKEAYNMFEQGNVSEAISILGDEILDSNYELARQQKENAERNLQKSQMALDQSIENYMLKARFCIANNNYQKANVNFSKAISIDSLNRENLMEYSDFLYSQKQGEISTRHLFQAMNVSYELSERAPVKYKLAKNFRLTNDFQNALIYSNEALRDFEQLALIDSIKYYDKISNSWSQLGLIYAKMKDYDNAEYAYYECISSSNPDDKNAIAWAYNLLGILYSRIDENVKADSVYRISLMLREELTILDSSEENLKRLAFLLSNYAALDRREGLHSEAKLKYNRAIEAYNKLSEINYRKYIDGVAFLHMKSGDLLREMSNYDEAEIEYRKSLQLYEELSNSNPLGAHSIYMYASNQLGDLLLFRKDYDASAIVYKKMISSTQEHLKYNESLDELRKYVKIALIYVDVSNHGSQFSESELILKKLITDLPNFNIDKSNGSKYYEYMGKIMLRLLALKRTIFEDKGDLGYLRDAVGIINSNAILVEDDLLLPGHVDKIKTLKKEFLETISFEENRKNKN